MKPGSYATHQCVERFVSSKVIQELCKKNFERADFLKLT